MIIVSSLSKSYGYRQHVDTSSSNEYNNKSAIHLHFGKHLDLADHTTHSGCVYRQENRHSQILDRPLGRGAKIKIQSRGRRGESSNKGTERT